MNSVFSVNGEDWVDDFSVVVDRLMGRHKTEDKKSLIGKEYFEGDKKPAPTRELFDIDTIIDVINENAYEAMGEYAEDYPNLSPEERGEFMDLIVGFLDKKDPCGFFHVENIRKKTITEKDVEEKIAAARNKMTKEKGDR
jgi:hypothetical protein